MRGAREREKKKEEKGMHEKVPAVAQIRATSFAG